MQHLTSPCKIHIKLYTFSFYKLPTKLQYASPPAHQAYNTFEVLFKAVQDFAFIEVYALAIKSSAKNPRYYIKCNLGGTYDRR